MKRSILLSTALMVMGSASFAGNLAAPIVAPAPVVPVAPMTIVPSNDWTGFYIGGQYNTGDVDLSGDLNQDGNDDAADALLDSTDDIDGFGVHAGYLRDLGTFVVGGEFDYDMLEIDGGGDADVMRLKGIAGYDLGRFMPYLTAGAANIDVDGLDDDIVGFYGLGGKYAITDSLLVGAEYLVHNGDDFADTGINVDVDTLSLRMSYKF